MYIVFSLLKWRYEGKYTKLNTLYAVWAEREHTPPGGLRKRAGTHAPRAARLRAGTYARNTQAEHAHDTIKLQHISSGDTSTQGVRIRTAHTRTQDTSDRAATS